MGKISDALEKSKKENTIKLEKLPVRTVEPATDKETPSIPVMNKITSHNINNKLIVITAPDSYEAESFKLLRAQILFAKNREKPKIIMVTSAMPGDGKTFVAANLAASIALGIDEHVLLVDGDLRRPNLHKMFGISNKSGLHEYLKKEKDLSELLIKTSINKLSFLPAGSAPHNPSELLASGDMKSFLEEVRERYDDRFIILDTPPSQIMAESNVMSNFVDGIIFVIRESMTPRDMVRKAINALGKDKILGTVVNAHSQLQKSQEEYYGRYYKNS